MWRAGGGRHRARAVVRWDTILRLPDRGKAAVVGKREWNYPLAISIHVHAESFEYQTCLSEPLLVGKGISGRLSGSQGSGAWTVKLVRVRP